MHSATRLLLPILKHPIICMCAGIPPHGTSKVTKLKPPNADWTWLPDSTNCLPCYMPPPRLGLFRQGYNTKQPVCHLFSGHGPSKSSNVLVVLAGHRRQNRQSPPNIKRMTQADDDDAKQRLGTWTSIPHKYTPTLPLVKTLGNKRGAVTGCGAR